MRYARALRRRARLDKISPPKGGDFIYILHARTREEFKKIHKKGLQNSPPAGYQPRIDQKGNEEVNTDEGIQGPGLLVPIKPVRGG